MVGIAKIEKGFTFEKDCERQDEADDGSHIVPSVVASSNLIAPAARPGRTVDRLRTKSRPIA